MPLPTKKRKRKPSNDKDVEALLVLKDTWNFQASNFINELIALKRGLNGRGDPQYMLPPGRVTKPFDTKVPTFINQLTQKYRVLSSAALEITQKQDELSKHKAARKSEHKSESGPGNEGHNPFSVLTQKSSHYEAQLVAEATNPLTRSLWRFKSLFNSDHNMRAKWEILSLSVQAKQTSKDLQNAAVSGGNDTTERIEKHYNILKAQFRDMGKFLRTTIDPKDAEFGSLVIDDPLMSELKKFQREFNSAYNLGEVRLRTRFLHFEKQFRNAEDEVEKQLIINQIAEYYSRVQLLFKEKFPTEWKGSIYQLEKDLPVNMKVEETLEEKLERQREIKERTLDWRVNNESAKIVDEVKKSNEGLSQDEPAAQVPEIPFEEEPEVGTEGGQDFRKGVSDVTKLAHNFMSRYLKKKLLDMPFSGKSSLFRIGLYKKTQQMIKELNSFMDGIQSNSPNEELYTMFNSMKKLLEDIRIEKENLASILVPELKTEKSVKQVVKKK